MPEPVRAAAPSASQGQAGARSGSSGQAGARSGSSGQAAVELVAALPALILAGALALQLLAAGYALTLADGAAESGAAALAAGGRAVPAARSALPGWAAERVAIEAEGGRVRVELRVPALIPLPAGILEVDSTAAVAGALP